MLNDISVQKMTVISFIAGVLFSVSNIYATIEMWQLGAGDTLYIKERHLSLYLIIMMVLTFGFLLIATGILFFAF